MIRRVLGPTFALCLAAAPARAQTPLLERVEHGFAQNGEVRIHYALLNEAGKESPLVVMIHGFPDYWYTWRDQMEALAPDFQVAAIDLRGYNLSDQPEGVASYAMPHLVGDVAAVIEHLGARHDTVPPDVLERAVEAEGGGRAPEAPVTDRRRLRGRRRPCPPGQDWARADSYRRWS